MINFIILRLNNLRIIQYFNFTGILRINQKKYKIPLLGKIGIHHLFGWEPWLDSILKYIIKFEKGTFVDVGANVGQTLLRIKSISPDIEYIGFEPNPTCVHYLNLLIKKNKISNASIFPVGISRNTSIEELTIYNNIECDGAASLVPNFRPSNKIFGKKYVPTFNIKSVKENIEFKNISVLKIDVEGMENVVLEEFKNEIVKYQPIVLIEILPVYSIENKDRFLRQKSIEKLVSEIQYSMFKVLQKKGELKKILKINEIGIHSDIHSVDYIFVPKSKKSNFEYFANNI